MPEANSADTVTSDEFAARLDALGAPRRFAIAVSGGRDSMALAVLARAYAKKMDAEVVALTVDHGLRAGSAQEVAQCAAWCKNLEIPHQALLWRGDKPETGIQATARAARYKLLATAAKAAGCDAVMTAHSADDQAETVFMRLSRGAGAAGLSAMAPSVKIADGAGAPVRLLRPLLAFSRKQLQSTARAAGQDYIDDPSNDDPAYERVRVRALLAALGAQDVLSGAALVQTAQKLAVTAKCLSEEEDALFDALGGCFYGWGGASLYRIGDTSLMAGLASRLIHAVSGEAYRPDDGAALRAVRTAREKGAATLGGVLVKVYREQLWFMREPSALLGRKNTPPAAPAPLEGPVLWDGRFIVRPHKDQTNDLTGFTIAPLGEGRLEFSTALFHGPREALMGSPAIYHNGALIAAGAFPSTLRNDFGVEALANERFRGEIIRF